MNRRETVLALLAFGAAPQALRAQTPARVARIGFLTPSYSALYKERLAVFKAGLRALGYVEDRDFVIVLKSANKKYDQLPALAAELVQMKVDVIVAAGGAPATLAARKATKTIPIVFPTFGYPVAQGVVASLARPGGNLTGITQQSADAAAKRMQFLKDLVPQAKRIAYLTNPGNSYSAPAIKETRAAGSALGLELVVVGVRSQAELEGTFGEMTQKKIDVLLISDDAILGDEIDQIASLALKRKIPTMGGNPVVPEAGCLASYGPNRLAMYERAATYVDKILKGAKPADLPVELAPKFDFVINMKTAKAIGLAVTPAVLQRADWVIE
ncbi:MAG TPA: ABC transporter substrate-binding protein [Burkholderiales bacterium]|nr:ABC transporter substrate-binding protein [Burkholderiales bacterium]